MASRRTRDPSVLPVSEYQHRYWAKWDDRPECTSFNTPLAFEIRGELDVAAFKKACHEVTKIQEITHAIYNEDGTEQYHGDFSVDDFFTEVDFSSSQDIEDSLRELFRRTFDLSRGPLVKFYLCPVDDRTHYFVLSAHHIITDAVWGPTMVSTIARAYRAYLRGEAPPVLEGPSYADCIEKLRRSAKPARKQKARAFWREFLGHAPRTVDFPRAQLPEFAERAADTIFFDLDPTVAKAARELADAHNSTLFIVLSAMFTFLLARYAEQEVVLASYPIDMRPHGYRHLVGCFVNLALIKSTIRPHTSLGMLVDELTHQRRRVRPHWHFSIRDLVRVGGEIDADIEETFFSVFFGETYLNTRPLQLEGLNVRYVNLPWSDEFDRELRLLYDASQPSGIRCRMDYRRAHYSRATIEDFVADFQNVLANALVSDRPLYEIADALHQPGEHQ